VLMGDSLWCPLFSDTQVLCRSVLHFLVGVFLHLKRCVQLVLLADFEVLVHLGWAGVRGVRGGGGVLVHVERAGVCGVHGGGAGAGFQFRFIMFVGTVASICIWSGTLDSNSNYMGGVVLHGVCDVIPLGVGSGGGGARPLPLVRWCVLAGPHVRAGVLVAGHHVLILGV
jgi:hypothetical protein